METKKKILIIDDDLFITDIYSLELQKSGYIVMTAENGELGLSKLQIEKPDLILLDIAMPGTDGLEVLKRIRANPEYEALKVLLLTNMKDEETIRTGLYRGANGYLIKTALTPEQIVEEVRKELENQKP